MTAQELDNLALKVSPITSNEKDDEYNIPLDMSDIINICRDFNSLGWQIQNQVESILEVGVEESIKTGKVKQNSLPHIKKFLKSIVSNPYFGDATMQANDSIKLIIEYEDKYKVSYITATN